jgi:hypothetical protein
MEVISTIALVRQVFRYACLLAGTIRYIDFLMGLRCCRPTLLRRGERCFALQQRPNRRELFAQEHQYVVKRHEANEPAVALDNWKPAKCAAPHQRQRRFNSGVFDNRFGIASHDLGHRRRERVAATGNRSGSQIAIDNDANRAAISVQNDEGSYRSS